MSKTFQNSIVGVWFTVINKLGQSLFTIEMRY